jgi:hypothetical protein
MISATKNVSLVFTFLVFLMMTGCAAAPLPPDKEPGPALSTQVVKYIPPDVPRHERSGSCWTGSIAAPRDHAWRCMVGNDIFDPCFALGQAVVCDANPAMGEEGFRLIPEKPLPSENPAAAEAGTGWLVQLADGRICNRATGARGMVDGRMTTYYCTSESPGDSAAVLGELNTGTVWTAEVAVMERTAWKIRERKIVPVIKVWQ